MFAFDPETKHLPIPARARQFPVSLENDASEEAHLNYLDGVLRDISGGWTISFWMYLNSDNNLTNSSNLFGFRNNGDTDGGLSVYFWNGDTHSITIEQKYSGDPRERAMSDNSFGIDEWFHICLTGGDKTILSETALHEYVNGIETTYQTNITATGTPETMGGPLGMLGGTGGVNQSMDGRMIGLGIFDREFNLFEIRRLAAGADPKEFDNCVFAPNWDGNYYDPITDQFPSVTGPGGLSFIADTPLKPRAPTKPIPVKTRDLGGIWHPDIRLDVPELLLPGNKPISGEMVLNEKLARDDNLILYYPMLKGELIASREHIENGIRAYMRPPGGASADFVPNDNTSSGLTHRGYETTGVSGSFAKSISSDGIYNYSGIGGASIIRVICGVTFKSLSVSAQNENTIASLLIDGANDAFLLRVDTSGNLYLRVRSTAADALQNATSTNTILAGVRYDMEFIIDYASDILTMNVNGQRWAQATGLSWASNTYNPGNPSAVDGLMGTDGGGTRWSDGIMHYFIVQKDMLLPEYIEFDPYKYLVPA